jgi:hypothetical protein
MYSTTSLGRMVDEAFEPTFALVDAEGHPLRTATMSAEEAADVNAVFKRFGFEERWMECEARKAVGKRP